MSINTAAIIQARSGSTRFKNKILAKLSDTTVIGYMLKRLSHSKEIDNIVIAIPGSDIELKKKLKKYNVDVFTGSETDVLERYYLAAKKIKADNIIRLTADCPLIDSELIDQMVVKYKKERIDYLGFGLEPNYPDGLGTEIFNFNSLENAFKNTTNLADREHVTLYIRSNPKIFKLGQQICKNDYGHIRVTIDYPEDLQVVESIITKLDKNNDARFSYNEIIKLYNNQPEIFNANKHLSHFNYGIISKYNGE